MSRPDGRLASTDVGGVVERISPWVTQSARGHGVADALVDMVERWARSVDARALRLDVAQVNRAATVSVHSASTVRASRLATYLSLPAM